MRVPRSQRGGEIVEPLVREQWFVRMEPLAAPALEAVANGSIKIVPERFEKVRRRCCCFSCGPGSRLSSLADRVADQLDDSPTHLHLASPLPPSLS